MSIENKEGKRPDPVGFSITILNTILMGHGNDI